MEFLPEIKQPHLRREPREGIQRTKRLIQKKKVAIEQYSTQQGNALAHAAREGRWIILGEVCQSETLEQFIGFLLRLFTRGVADIKAQHDILLNCSPWQEQRLLRHVASFAGAYFAGFAIDGYYS